MRRTEQHSSSGIPSERQQVLLFRVARQAYALPLLTLREILPLAKLAQVPALPAFVAGLLNLEGKSVAVISATRFFGGAESPLTLYSPMIVLRNDAPALALLVDAVERLAEIDLTELVPLAAGSTFHDCARGLIRIENEHAVLLDESRLITQEEARRLAEWTSIEQARLSPSEGAA